MSKKDTYIYYIFIICMYILLFQNALQNYISPFRWIDELIALSLIPIAVYGLWKKNFKINKVGIKKYYFAIIPIGIILILGIISNIVFKYQIFNAIVIDIIAIIKFPLAIILSMIVFDNTVFKFSKKIVMHVETITIGLSLCTIANYIFKLWSYSERYGIMANRLFFTHPTYFAATCISLFAILAIFRKKDDRDSALYFVILALLTLTTMRFKAITSIVISLLILVYVKKTNKKITIKMLGVLFAVGLLISCKQIYFYFVQIEDSARRMTTVKSVEIAKDHIPLGSGFGTFASASSATYYSPIYYKYNLNKVYGLEKGSAKFVSDNFWPMVLGQFGFIGFLVYLYFVLMIVQSINKTKSNNTATIYVGKMIVIVFLLLSSISESAFVNPYAIICALLLGLGELENDNKSKVFNNNSNI